MKAFMSDRTARGDETLWAALGAPRDSFVFIRAASLAEREARAILAETERGDRGDIQHARLENVRFFRRKARKDAETRSLFASEFRAHDALAEALAAFVADEGGETWDVHEGRPSWHQQRAGHISAAATTGFKSKADAEAFAERLRSHHPDMPVFVLRHVEVGQ